MRIAYALLATAAEFTADGRLWLLGGDLDTLGVHALPAVQPTLVLALKVLVSAEECGQEHHADVRILRPSGDTLLESADLPFTPVPNAAFPHEQTGVAFALRFNQLPLPESGRYIVQIRLDGEDVQALSLRVVETEQSSDGSRVTQEEPQAQSSNSGVAR